MDDATSSYVKIKAIKNQACFAKITDKEAEELSQLLVEKRIPMGQVIVNEGDLVDSVYFILSGAADVQKLSMKDNALVSTSVATLKAGDTIGLNETGFYSLNGKRTATVIALEEMVTLYLSVAEFHGFTLVHSHVNDLMHKNAAEFLAKSS